MSSCPRSSPNLGLYYQTTKNDPKPIIYPTVTDNFAGRDYFDIQASRSNCPPVNLPPPNPVHLNQNTDFGWNNETNIRRDCGAVTLDEKESQLIGDYQLSGFDPERVNASEYANRMSEILNFQKAYRDSLHYVDDETDLIHGDLSNLRDINQLFTRPYLGNFMGPGQPSLSNKDTETALFQGISTNLRQGPCQVTRGTSLYRFTPLPDFGNPQREQHIIPPPVQLGGWIRGGDGTRDYVRRVDYQKRCLDQINGNIVNKVPRCGLGSPNGTVLYPGDMYLNGKNV